MSKKVELVMDCPRCKAVFKTVLYRTIWVEFPENMELITADKINVVNCPVCGLSERQPFPFLATNVGKHVAVWYEPIPDPNIDADVALFRRHYGDSSFFAKAQRIKNWEEFKYCLIELNKGPEVPPTTEDLVRLRQGMRSAHAETANSLRRSTTSNPIANLRAWAVKLRRAYLPSRLTPPAAKKERVVAAAPAASTDGNKKSSKSSSSQANPIAKLEKAISTWERGQARIALAVYAATIFNNRAPLESLLGKGAKVETAIGRLTVGQLKVLHSIMAEIAPDDEDGG